jgi:hypothetical protein
MTIFLTSLSIVLYVIGGVAFLVGYKLMRKESAAHAAVYGVLCAVPVLVGLLIHTNVN